MRRLLLALFPAPWRVRYGEEFEALLEERPLGPFDVADVLLAAFDAHLHLRGLAAADHAKGFAMTLRIGGIAAILGGLLWAVGLAWASTTNSPQGEINPGAVVFLIGTLLLLLALIGLSAFQARSHPVLVWAAFIVPAIGALASITGMLAMATVHDGQVVASLSGWDIWALGVMTLVVGSGLFALASWRTTTVSRAGSALLGVAAVAFVLLIPTMVGVLPMPEPAVPLVTIGLLIAFAGGWIVLGIGAIRQDRPVSLTATGGAS